MGLPREKVSCAPDEEQQCPICLKAVEEGDSLMTLPCCHSFHDACVTAWLSKAANCPLCRAELPTDDPQWEEMKRQKKRKERREEDLEALHNSMFGWKLLSVIFLVFPDCALLN